MKKIIKNTPLILFVLYLFVPICFAISSLLKYKFIIFNNIIFELILVLISFLLIQRLNLNYDNEKIEVNKFSEVILFILPLISLVNLFFYAGISGSLICAILALINCIFSIYLVIKFIKKQVIKIISIALFFVVSFIIAPLVFVFVAFGYFGKVTVIDEALSLNGKMTAKLIDDDQGALGGNTYVYVYENNKDINLYIIKFEKEPLTIYQGKWGEFDSMKIGWKDNNTLLINEKEYKIN